MSLLVVVSAFGAEKQKPYPHYWMSIATSSQSIPGMPAEMGRIASIFGGKEESGTGTDSPAKEIGNKLRGIFGF